MISWGEICMAVWHFLYLSVVSIAIGIGFGFLSAFLSKRISTFKDHPSREIILIFVLAYLSYMISEELNLSGIITLFCCGFTMNHYTYYNLSEESKNGSVLAIQTLSHFSEAAIYAYLGFAAFSIKKDNFSITLILILVGVTILARFFAVLIPLSVLRLFQRKNPQN
jgi:solute carrier family 9 (sodium/hydrogen exchanger), member 6/7